ncbi:hypothetical protein AWC05_04615 [Mycobacterium florentinum]|uniref:Uncharacterized protein n=1 Tax=Mycobacterium florentinum TaxID=292462 RepID=A0A1X1TTG1_MYCFL|nr:hypothetical protein [Mycobacterium florentinum]MCV7408305.1 hypothetical protein [Mycobacterium florentinum]ORV47874.1 hypothetical protein AWC05_04615 [Mycobacterium florentinum]BBX78201.1 ESX-1 secretion-associated protein EspB [Mycobacterium florentinum]
MTQPQALNVEYAELIARANEIEELLPPIPSANPVAPCGLSMASDAVTQLGLSADSIRLYLKGCEREWKTLAKTLRNAAKAYEEVDEGAADAMNDDRPMPASVGGNGLVSASDDSDMPFDPPAPRPAPPVAVDPYYEVRQATMAIEAGDQGATCKAFVQEWHAFQFALQQVASRFRPFTSWEGDARTAVEQNFELQRQWIASMVQLCCSLRDQANDIVDAQEKIRPASGTATQDFDGNYLIPEEHPGPGDILFVENTYKTGVECKMQALIDTSIEWYAILQKKSETALRFYRDKTVLPPLNPPMFPTAAGAADAVDFNGRTGIPDGVDPGNLADELAGGLPGAGMPTLPSAGMPAMPNASMPTAVPPLPAAGKGLPKGAQVKPASVGGGGVGVPSLPKPTWAPAGAPSGAGPAAPGVGPGKVAVPAAYAALNGTGAGMGGGMPMGGQGGQGQGAGKGKRVQTEDEALYTEERAWTEGVIGRRRAS